MNAINYRTKMVCDIESVGWHVTWVFPTPEHPGPPWAYTIGLFKTFDHPEVLIFGLPFDTSGSVLNLIGREVAGGKQYKPGTKPGDTLYSGILEDHWIAFQNVHPNHYRSHVGLAIDFYWGIFETGFPLLQCFWPDREGIFPWQSSCDPGVRSAQPLLFAPPRSPQRKLVRADKRAVKHR